MGMRIWYRKFGIWKGNDKTVKVIVPALPRVFPERGGRGINTRQVKQKSWQQTNRQDDNQFCHDSRTTTNFVLGALFIF
jgi:hypothetical protein